MSEDPVKFYVVVMAVLLCVLGVVAFLTYQEASAYESAVERAPAMARSMRENGADLLQLVKQLAQGRNATRGALEVIQDVAARLGITNADTGEEERPARVPNSRARERRFYFRTTRRSGNLTREQVATLCRQVEQESGGLYRTIDIRLERDTGPEGVPAGSEEVSGDTYRANIVFGYRYIPEDEP